MLEKLIESLEERIVGRYLAEDLKSPDDNSLIKKWEILLMKI